MEELKDDVLVGQVRQGRVESYGLLVQRYQSGVYNVCCRLLGQRQDAEDLAQETFIRAYQRLGTYDSARPFGPWVRRVAANLCYNHLKRSMPVEEGLEEEWLASGPEPDTANPAHIFEQNQQSYRVRAALLALPPRYRVVVELRHYQDMDYQEMAETLGLPLNTVKSHLLRARRLLAERLAVEVRVDGIG